MLHRVPHHGSRVLVVDDDLGILEMIGNALRHEGHEVQTARCGIQGIAVAERNALDLMCLDFQLPDMFGTEIVRALQHKARPVPFILFSAFLTIPITVDAMKLGAVHVAEKPVVLDDLLEIVRQATSVPHHQTPPLAAHPRSAAERWAKHVLTACKSDGDLKTLEDWARFVGVSYTSLCESCRLLGIRPHDARDLSRVLRAIIRSAVENCRPEVLLDVSDRRTLDALLRRAGRERAAVATPISVGDFLDAQGFVPTSNEGFRVLRRLLELSDQVTFQPTATAPATAPSRGVALSTPWPHEAGREGFGNRRTNRA